jgi:hypothetical protein
MTIRKACEGSHNIGLQIGAIRFLAGQPLGDVQCLLVKGAGLLPRGLEANLCILESMAARFPASRSRL